MTLVEAIAAVVCEPGVHTTDPVILSATLQVHCMTVEHVANTKCDDILLYVARFPRGTCACRSLYCSAHSNKIALCQACSKLA